MFNWDEFRNGKVAVHCDTEEKAKEFVEECFKRDINYFDRSKESDWYNYKENMCYCIIGSDLCYGSKSFFIGDGYKIIKWESGYTEFTFQEVISRNIPGIYKNCNDDMARVQSIEINEYGDLTINADFTGLKEINLGLGINPNLKFKLQEPKKKYVLYGIEHQEDGKIYFFRSKEDKVIPDGSFVICNTSKGKSYGRAVQRIEKELTESEYKQYKECWRA